MLEPIGSRGGRGVEFELEVAMRARKRVRVRVRGSGFTNPLNWRYRATTPLLQTWT